MKTASPAETVKFVKDLGNSIRENPISAALIGMGLVWLFTGGRTVELARRTGADPAFDGASSMASGVASNAHQAPLKPDDVSSPAGVSAGDIGATSLHRMSTAESLRAAPEAYGDMASNLRSSLTNLFEKQPLFLGAAAVTLGAGIAASIPSTDLEADLLGETSDDLRQTISRLASEQKENARNIVAEMAIAAAKEALSGLTFDDIQNAVRDTAGSIQRVMTPEHQKSRSSGAELGPRGDPS
jgi:hypothetical protein